MASNVAAVLLIDLLILHWPIKKLALPTQDQSRPELTAYPTEACVVHWSYGHPFRRKNH